MDFYSSYNPPKTIASNPGCRYSPEYKLAKDDDSGEEFLVKIGETDNYANIQSFAASVDIGTRLARFMNGDETALQGANGVYADLRGVPSNYADAARMAVNAAKMFDELPADVREVFGNDFSNFKYEFTRGNVERKILLAMSEKNSKKEVKETANE